jgi:hypothetical protein
MEFGFFFHNGQWDGSSSQIFFSGGSNLFFDLYPKRSIVFCIDNNVFSIG